jgi:guanylate kinase
MHNQEEGKLIVISGPSGVGKGTVINKLIAKDSNIKLSTSITTRAKRPKEVDGEDYHFISKEQFRKLIEKEELAEWADFAGNYYGTYWKTVDETLAEGKDLILEIEVKGAMQIKKQIKETILIFVMPPSFEELKNRLFARNTEDEETIMKRLAIYEDEFAKAREFDYLVTNNNIDETVEKLYEIILKERAK